MGDEGGVASGIQPDRIATVRIIPIKVWGGEGGGAAQAISSNKLHVRKRKTIYRNFKSAPAGSIQVFFFFFFQALFFFHRKNDVGLRNG